MQQRNNLWQWFILAVVIMWSLFEAIPLNKKLTLGIDLKGGYQFLLEVDPTKITAPDGGSPSAGDLADAQARALEVLRNRIDGLGNKEIVLYPEPNSTRIVLQIPGVGDENRKVIEDMLLQPAYLQFRVVHPDNDMEVSKLMGDGKAPPGYVVETVNFTRKDGKAGSGTFLRKLDDPELETLKGKARQDRLNAQAEAVRRFESKPAYDLLLEEEILNDKPYYRPVYVQMKEQMNGSYITRAFVGSDEYGLPSVDMEFNTTGGEKFGEMTGKMARAGTEDGKVRYLAIVLDGRLYSRASVKSAIPGGMAKISGSFSYDDARKLAIALQAGALPAPVTILSQDEISPTLGADSIRSGIQASIVGAAVVMLFMLVYYLKAGVIANLALIVDLLLMPAGAVIAAGILGIFASNGGESGAGLPTLTLPGIAGLVLTIGMAVDANVLIYERIREELRNGKRLANAVQAGFDKVFSTILDSNLTTLISAIILFLYGTGTIRGFAVTLTAGILVSMYTALVFTRLMFDLLVRINPDAKLPMLQFFGKTNINFLKYRHIAAGISVLLVLGGVVHMVVKGKGSFGVDFTGGSAITFQYAGERKEIKDLREALTKAGVGENIIQYRKDLSSGKELLEVTAGMKESDKIITSVESFDGYKSINKREIGEQVGREMISNGLTALFLSMLGIIIYVSIRFEFSFAVGAIVALLHDVLVAVGIYVLFDRPIGLITIAALLTIIGYSVNDTIVIFDRIREDSKLKRNIPFLEVCNIALNETLSRTIITSLTVLFTVAVLVIFGGGAIFDFALVMLLGVIAGTYSTIYIATPVMLFFRKEQRSTNASKPTAS